MAAYSTKTDLQTLIPSSIWDSSATSPVPTVSQVEGWITEVDGEIDAKLAGRYSLPIAATATASLALLKSISMRLAAIRLWGAVFTAQTGDQAIPADWRRAATLLDDLAAGRATLSDATSLVASSTGSPGTPISSFDARPMQADPYAGVEQTEIFSLDRDL